MDDQWNEVGKAIEAGIVEDAKLMIQVADITRRLHPYTLRELRDIESIRVQLEMIEDELHD